MKKWDEESMQKAIKGVREGLGSIRKMAQQYHVPVMTLQNRLNGSKSAKEASEATQVLHPVHEQLIVNWIERQSDFGTPPNRHDILAKGQEYSRLAPVFQSAPRESWVKAFKARTKDLRAKTDTSRAKMSHINYWYDEELPDMGADFSSLWNMGMIRIADQLGTWTKFLECVSLSGDKCPPFVLFNGGTDETKNVPQCHDWNAEVEPYRFSTSSPDDDKITTHPQLALLWLTKTFDPYTKHLDRRVLTVDHRFVSDAFYAECERRQIELFVMPPHTSHVTQPFQVDIAGPLKTQFRRLMTLSPPVEHANKRHVMLKVYGQARRDTINSSVTRLAFKRAGVWPVSKNYALENEFLAPVLEAYNWKKQCAELRGEIYEESDSEDEQDLPPSTPPRQLQNPDPEQFPDFEEYPGSPVQGPLGEIWVKGQTTDDEKCKAIYREISRKTHKALDRQRKIEETLGKIERGEEEMESLEQFGDSFARYGYQL